MNETNDFERLIADVTREAMGPTRPVDVETVTHSAATSVSVPRASVVTRPAGLDPIGRPERGLSMFSAVKLVTAASIIALFGGFLMAGLIDPPDEAVPPAAESPSSEVSFDPETMKMSRASGEVWYPKRLEPGVASMSDLRSHSHDQLWNYPLNLDDPRLSGQVTAYNNYDQFSLVSAGGSDTLMTGGLRIDNDDGSWTGQLSGFSDDLWRFTAWLEGDGAYEGMGAVLHFEVPVSADNVDPITVNGLVFPGEMPPFPAIPEAPVE